MNRGSEWRKWDLHIHTPGTAKNNQFKGVGDIWEKYIEALENTDIAVFGITDYFSIRNYVRVREYQKQGRLKNICILPNVEMRLLPVTGKSNPINIHAIFDPYLGDDEIEREFFRPLQFHYEGSDYSCVDGDLAALGRQVACNKALDDAAAIKRGIETFAISPETLRKIINKDFFKGHIVIALSNGTQDGVSGIMKHEGDLQPLRKEITSMADIIFSGNSSDISYFLGEGVDDRDKVIATYRSLKPCVIGSDAHSFDQIGIFPNNRITWIKADTTFEGLKQILFEPKERVCISDAKPNFKYDFNTIDYVELNKEGIWNQKIPFNQNLNTIIGGRSTGKSTLLASIAAKFQEIKNAENKTYIKDLSDSVRVFWRDGQETNNKEIDYFTQNEIANLTSNGEPDKLFREILTSKDDMRKSYEKYKADEADTFSTIQSKVALFFEKRRQFNEKSTYVKKLGDSRGVNLEIEKLSKERDSIQQKMSDKKELIEKFQIIDKELSDLRIEETSKQQEIEQLNRLANSEFFINNSEVSYSGLTEVHLQKISEEVQRTLTQSNLHVQDFIKTLIPQLNNNLITLRKKIAEKQNIKDYVEGKKIFEEHKNLALIIEQISSLSKQMHLINKETEILVALNNERREIASELLSHHLSYLELINSTALDLHIQYENIVLSAKPVLKNELEDRLTNSISLRANSMNEMISDIVKRYKGGVKEDIKGCLKDVLNKALDGEITFKNGVDEQVFVNMMLANNWFELRYNVDYEGDSLTDMSPGKRSFVVLKLLLDFSDKRCPILIDQPEDNLDNRAIYNELVKYIREKKKERQIILVTHNPNIVVGADSEEVIVANQNGKNAPNDKGIKFQYVYGSLENSKHRKPDDGSPILSRCGIREHVCDILEGGESAFKDREHKYGFFKV